MLGMLFGSDGVIKIAFDNYEIAEQICSVALIFIMFYGGFGTRWSEARPVAGKSVLLSSVGVVLTAVLTGPVLLLRFEHGFPGGYADRFRSWFHGCRFRILDSAFPQA